MTPIEELNKSIEELAKMKERAEEKYKDVLENLRDFKEIITFRTTYIFEVFRIGEFLGYPDKKIKTDINKVLKGTGEEK